MTKKSFTHFGEIEINPPDEWSEGTVSIDNTPVSLDLNFYEGVPDHDWVTEYENYVNDLQQHKAEVDAAINADFQDQGAAKEYVDFHIEELDAPVIDEVLARTTPTLPKEERLLSALKLVRVGIYPGEENYAVWDYTIGSDITDMLVVVNTDSMGRVQYVTMEN